MKFLTLSSILGSRETGMVKRLLVYGAPSTEETILHRALMRFAQVFGVDSHDCITIQEGIALDEALMKLVTPDARLTLSDFTERDGEGYRDLEYFTQLKYVDIGEDYGDFSR